MPPSRLAYLDNLRVGLIALVIAHHVGQAYGPTGGSWPIQEAARAALLGPFFTVNRSFFMSLFFLVAGYFTVSACDARGPAAFARGRLLRLGVPVLVWGLVLIPLRVFVFAPAGQRGPVLPIDVGHLWFLEHLLLFSVGYALWRHVRRHRARPRPAGPPRTAAMVAAALVLAVVSGVIRHWFPIDRWIHLLWFFQVAFADVPRDLGFFIIGLLAGRNRWFESFPARAGWRWLGVGVAASACWYAYALWLGRLLPLSGVAYSIVYPLWEELVCFGMSIGLVVLFREMLNRAGRLLTALGRAQYAAYILHLPVVVGFHAAALRLPLPSLAKFALVTLLAVPVTFLISHWVRRPLHL